MGHSISYWVWTSIILTAAVLAATLSQIVAILIRRWLAIRRNRTFSVAFSSIQNSLQEFGQGRCEYAVLLKHVQSASSTVPALALQEWMLSSGILAEHRHAVASLAIDVGWLAAWQDALNPAGGQTLQGSSAENSLPKGERVLAAARKEEAARKLALIGVGLDDAALVSVLDDPNPEVTRAVLRSGVVLGGAKNLELLCNRLWQCATAAKPPVSVRTLCGAMVKFPLSESAVMLSSLQHSQPRVRLLAAWVVLEMVKRARQECSKEEIPAMPQAVQEVFLTQLAHDPKPDVRARAVAVAGYLTGPRATAAVANSMRDQEWIVRLHASRAAGLLRDPAQIPLLRALLQDSNWRVREAAARSLADWKPDGLDALLKTLMETHDGYAREQIVEILQWKNLLDDEVRWLNPAGAVVEIRRVADIINCSDPSRPDFAREAERMAGFSTQVSGGDRKEKAPDAGST